MGSRAWVSVVVALAGLASVTACKKKPAGDGSGSGSAATSVAAKSVDAGTITPPPPPPVTPPAPPPVTTPAAAAACLPSSPDGGLEAFTADDKLATVCVTGAQASLKCIALDLATGVAHDAAHPPAAAAKASAFTVTDDASGVQLCKGAACTKLPIKTGDVGDAGTGPIDHHVTVSANGIFAIAFLPDDQSIGIFDTTSGRKTTTIAKTNTGSCLEGARWLDDVIYVTHSNCNSPTAEAELYGQDGKKIATLDGLNVEHGDPVKLTADTWAVPGLGGAGALVFEPKSGRILRKAVGAPDKFAPCAGCAPVGAGVKFTASPLAVTPGGKLVELGDSGGVWILDPATGATVKAWPITTCAP